MNRYIHGYSEKEKKRLADQASTLVELLHYDSIFPAGEKVLEAGCGLGSQTVTLARMNPDTHFTSIDISEESLEEARRRVSSAGLENVEFFKEDIFNLHFEPDIFDRVFVCFVLEHLPEPLQVLNYLGDVLKPGGIINVIEGDHGSAYFHPDSEYAHKAIQCQIALQASAGGNSMIGRELYPLLVEAGFKHVEVSPRMVYVDASKPELVEGFIKNTFTSMIEGVKSQALQDSLTDEETFDRGVRDLYRTTENDGTFSYTFFKAQGHKALVAD